MENPPKARTINLNLKQISTADSKSTKNSSENKTNQSASKSNEQFKEDLKKTNEFATTKCSTESNSSKKKSDLQKTKSPNKISISIESNSNEKRLKVPFDLSSSSKASKNEPKYSKENTNLRLLNQANESRKELIQNKFNKPANETIVDRNSVKNLITSNNQQIKKQNINTKTQDLTKNVNSSGKSTKIEDDSNKKAVLYLKCLPDQFNYLDNDNSESLEAIEFRLQQDRCDKQKNFKTIDTQRNLKNQANNPNNLNMNQINRSTDPIRKKTDSSFIKTNPSSFSNDPQSRVVSQNSHLRGINKADFEFNQKSDSQLSNPQQNDQPFDVANNMSSEFLKNQKERLEIERLINFKIKNEDEKIKAKNVIDSFMASLIAYKRLTYPSDLIEKLENGIKETVKS